MSKHILYPFFFFAILLSISIATILPSCKSSSARKEFEFTGDTIADGKQLVALHCVQCHQLIEPQMLTKEVWLYHGLPGMAKYFGISTYGHSYFEKNPDSAKLTPKEWQFIVSYYTKLAPEELKAPAAHAALLHDWAGFSLKMPDSTALPSFTTMIAGDPGSGTIYVGQTSGNANVGTITSYDHSLKPKTFISTPTPVVNTLFLKDKASNGSAQAFFTCIGQLPPVDFPNGRILQHNLDKTDQSAPKLIASELARPVQTIEGDFNKDGLNDLVICSKGNTTGGVYLLTQNNGHGYSQSTIAEKPGAVQAVAGDFNNDGWLDVMVLYGYGDEGLWLYTNNKKGGFSGKQLLRFPPVYGSTSFQLADLDHDGKLDVIYTCGYNYYDSRILKPYHGIYTFKNDGDWNLQQTWFYPINGCTKAIAADFDGDGDLDIAASAFFADYKNNPSESFIYFEQDKPLTFKPHAVPLSNYGRWFTMDVADYNHDGKPDILLGNYSHGFLNQQVKPFWKDHLPFIILQNNFKK